jgi:hypothetical protein
MRIPALTLLLSAALLLPSCNRSAQVDTQSSATPAASGSATPSTAPGNSPAPVTPEANAAENTVISAKGIGAAQLGITFAQLKQILGNEVTFTVKSPFIVDFDAIAVSKAGEIQYYILYLANQPFSDNDIVQGILTENPKFRTSEGVGAGTSIADAAKAYGKATLAYNTQNESREYVRFERQPASNISFATGNGSQQPAGIYPSPTSEYNETQQFRPDATIKSVLVVCLADACAASQP